MAFDRLQELGEEKFGKILNLLMRGEPAQHLARNLQAPPPDGWGIFQDVQERTLTQQLNRLRLAAAEGAFGKKTAKKLAEGHTPQIRMLERVSVRVLERLEELSEAQRERVFALIAREKKLMEGDVATTVLSVMTQATDAVVKDYRQILLDLQKIRFDLGLDEFKGPIHGMAVRAASQSVTMPDGTNIQKQVFEAVNTIEAIFDARKIPQLIARE